MKYTEQIQIETCNSDVWNATYKTLAIERTSKRSDIWTIIFNMTTKEIYLVCNIESYVLFNIVDALKDEI